MRVPAWPAAKGDSQGPCSSPDRQGLGSNGWGAVSLTSLSSVCEAPLALPGLAPGAGMTLSVCGLQQQQEVGLYCGHGPCTHQPRDWGTWGGSWGIFLRVSAQAEVAHWYPQAQCLKTLTSGSSEKLRPGGAGGQLAPVTPGVPGWLEGRGWGRLEAPSITLGVHTGWAGSPAVAALWPRLPPRAWRTLAGRRLCGLP